MSSLILIRFPETRSLDLEFQIRCTSIFEQNLQNLIVMDFIDLVNDRTMAYVSNYISKCRESRMTVVGTDVEVTFIKSFTSKHVGKVRDSYICEDCIIIITTDRQSAFDRQLASIPFKGQVLNLTAQWWFNQTIDIVPNHVIACPHPNVTIAKKCRVFPVEFVVRGYITGTTSTSMWTNYAKGIRNYCGHVLPEDLKKNQKLSSNLLTPTTKDDNHDELISAEEIVSSGRMSFEDWMQCETYALELFSFGQIKALESGLILVDTKYEFGKDSEGNITLIDEIHTPDSSRYWIAKSYSERMAEGKVCLNSMFYYLFSMMLCQEPDNIDKEFLRRWFVDHCDPYKDDILPEAPAELVDELSRRCARK